MKKHEEIEFIGQDKPIKKLKKNNKVLAKDKNSKKPDKHNTKKEKNSNKMLIIIPLIILIIGGAIGVYLYSNTTETAITLKKYFQCISNKDYDGAYQYVTTETTKEEFVSRLKNIYEGIEASDISIKVATNSSILNKESEEQEDINVTYTTSMKTSAGELSFINSATFKLVENQYKIKWNSSIIYPDLQDNQKIRVSAINSERGTIYDRNGNIIAKEGKAYQVGLVPGKMNETTDVKKIAELLQIKQTTIEQSLKESYVTNDTFVPIKKISREEQELKAELLKIKGIMISDIKVRVYPYKEATSILTGYVQENDGKSGIEYAFNDKLKGHDGEEIYITDDDGRKIKTIIKRDVKNGEDIHLTIDVQTQNKLYEQFKDDEGTSVAVNYNTGEILAMVSTPSYNANDFSLGISEEKWESLKNDKRKPLYSRYLATYTPGSTFKPIVGAIGINNNYFSATDDFGASGTKWQNDKSWKNLYVTTLEKYSEPANLENALVYSDNIYFAKAAIKIEKENLKRNLDNIGFNEKIEFAQEIAQSTYGKIDSEPTLANSGYGQNEIMVNPIHMASIYSAFANGGNMVKPYIILDDKNKTKYWKESVISEETANTIKNDLIQVVERGTAKDCKIEGKTIAGKTGTAEIKASQDDKDGEEIGWFNAFDEDGLLVISLIENAKSKSGSHYVVNKIRTIFE